MEEFYLLILFATVCFCAIVYRQFRSRNTNTDGMKIPGPKAFPIIGNVLDTDLLGLHISLSKLADKYGPIFRIKLLGNDMVVLNDAELVRKAYGSSKYGDAFNDRADAFYGKYLCFDNCDIALAKANKKTWTKRKMFHRSLKFYGDGIQHFNKMNEDELVELLEKLKKTNECDFDMADTISKSLANTLAMLLDGTHPSSRDSEAIVEYSDTAAFFVSAGAFLYDLFPIIRFLPGYFGDRYRKAIAARDHLLDRFYFSVRDAVDTSADVEIGVVKNLIKLQDEINQKAGTDYITDNDVKGITAEIIAGSHVTTTVVLTNAFAIILTHPRVAKEIQAEIDNVVGSSRMPTDSDREHMHYTMATIYEVLRYTSPVLLGVPHLASKDQNLEGYFVPKDSLLFSNTWHMHHDPNVWHEPWVFKPERFLDEAGKLLPPENPVRRNIMTFSTGRRECPGQNFGKFRIFFYLSAVLQCFDIVAASDGRLPDTDPRNYEKEGLHVRVKPYRCRVLPRVATH